MRLKLFAPVLLLASSGLARAQEFNFDKYFSDACDARDQAAFCDSYLTVRTGTSLAGQSHWLFPDDVYFGNNGADCNLVALAFSLVPEQYEQEVLRNLVTDIIRKNGGHYVGDPRTLELVLPLLSRYGRSDVAYLLTQRDSALFAAYAPTWEREVLAGISRQFDGKYRLRPDFSVEDLCAVADSMATPEGLWISSWRKNLMRVEWDVTVPAACEIWLPTVHKRMFRHRRGARFVRFEDKGSVWRIKPGRRHISVPIDMPDPLIAEEAFLYDEAPNRTCHSASITELQDGTMLAVYTGGDNEAAPNTRVYLSRREKGSAGWSEPVEATHSSLSDTVSYCTYNPVIWQIPDGSGEILLFYHTSVHGHKRCFLMRSADGGLSWSVPEELPDGVNGPERSQPLYLNGRIVTGGDTQQKYSIRPLFSISEDRGYSWSTAAPASAEYGIAHNNRAPGRVGENFDVPADDLPRERAFEILATNQPAIIRYPNGLLQALCRSCHSKLSSVWSYDGGLTWGHEYLTDQVCNQSGFSAITLRDGRFVKVFNDFESLPGVPRWEQMNPRTPLTLAISDDGMVWKKVLDIETGPIHSNKFPSGYCYPNVIEGSDGYLHLVYTWQRRRIKYVKLELPK